MPAKYGKRGRKPDKTGRSKGEASHWRLHSAFVQTSVFRSLSGPALKVLAELHSRFNGYNNGKISLSYQDAADLLSLSKGTVSRAFAELQEKGFIQLRRPGQWYGRLAAEWILTEESLDGQLPTRDYQKWAAPARPKKQKSVLSRNTNAADGSTSVPRDELAFHQSTRRGNLRVVDGST